MDKVKQTSLHEEHIEEKKKEVAELQDTIKEYENRVQQLNGEWELKFCDSKQFLQ